jgi:hypothetical protein
VRAAARPVNAPRRGPAGVLPAVGAVGAVETVRVAMGIAPAPPDRPAATAPTTVAAGAAIPISSATGRSARVKGWAAGLRLVPAPEPVARPCPWRCVGAIPAGTRRNVGVMAQTASSRPIAVPARAAVRRAAPVRPVIVWSSTAYASAARAAATAVVRGQRTARTYARPTRRAGEGWYVKMMAATNLTAPVAPTTARATIIRPIMTNPFPVRAGTATSTIALVPRRQIAAMPSTVSAVSATLRGVSAKRLAKVVTLNIANARDVLL